MKCFKNKKWYSFNFLVISFLFFIDLSAQNIGINATGVAPHNSAGLDINFQNKGLLIPRLSTFERDAIVNPAKGLLIYNTTTNCYDFYNIIWQSLGCSLPEASISSLNCGSSVLTGTVIQNVSVTGVSIDIPYSGGNGGMYQGQVINSTGVTGLTANLSSGSIGTGNGSITLIINGIASSTGNANFLIDFGGESCIFLVPVCQAGLGNFICTSATQNNGTSFVANWTTSNNASSYALDVSMDMNFNNFISGFDNLNVGNVQSYLVTGLTSNTAYYYRVRSMNTCGTSSNSNTINLTTSISSCDLSQAETSYGTVTNIPGATSLIWIDRNLGATNQATSLNDASDAAAGCYFQFNRPLPYTNNISDGINTVNPAWIITYIDENSNWLISNDPCRINLGGLWRLPTFSEWTNVDAANNWNNSTDAFLSNLKISNAGYLSYSSGGLIGRGIGGGAALWSSTQGDNIFGFYMGLASNFSDIYYGRKTYGFNVRCVK